MKKKQYEAASSGHYTGNSKNQRKHTQKKPPATKITFMANSIKTIEQHTNAVRTGCLVSFFVLIDNRNKPVCRLNGIVTAADKKKA